MGETVETTLGASSRSTEREVEGRVAALKSNWGAVWRVRAWIRSMICWSEAGWRVETREQKRKVTCFHRMVRIVGAAMEEEEVLEVVLEEGLEEVFEEGFDEEAFDDEAFDDDAFDAEFQENEWRYVEKASILCSGETWKRDTEKSWRGGGSKT